MSQDNAQVSAVDYPGTVLSGKARRHTIAAAAAGNFVEWYDAGIYGIAATVISQKLFPSASSPTIALLNTYAVFAISYLLRPFGGIVFGHLADKVGRRRSLSITIVFTSLATGLIGLIPDYSLIGWAAPILLLVLRLIQSMGTGGEYSAAISFVYEHGPRGHKATAVGSMTSLTFVGFLVGAGLSTLLTTLPGSGYASYGWRILFLVAIPIGLVGLYLRKRTEEGPEFKLLQETREKLNVDAKPVMEALRLHWKQIALFTAFMGSWAVYATMLTNYLPTFLKANPGMNATLANGANLLSSAMIVVLILIFSPIADRIGLRAAMIIGAVVILIGTIPGFLIAGHGITGGYLGAALLGACKGVLAVPMLLAVSQIFPASVRVTAGGLAYNVATSLIGGTSPFIAVWLNSITGSSILFASYIMFFALITLVIALLFARRWIEESQVHSGDAAAKGAAGVQVMSLGSQLSPPARHPAPCVARLSRQP